jgi:DNA-binding MarR family transcriptional regulator
MATTPYSARAYWLARIVREADALLDASLSRFEITGAQWRAFSLVLAGRADTIRGLAAALQVDGAAATRLVDRLEAKGFVARQPDPRDRRSVVVTATAPARRLAGDIEAIANAAEADFFERVGGRDLKAIDRAIAALTVGHGLGRVTKSGNLRPPKPAG